LLRTNIGLSIYRHRLFNCRDQETLADSEPHVPVFDERQRLVETTCVE